MEPKYLRTLVPILLGFSACAGGGGGSGGEPGIDEGEYTVDSFGYEDPNPPGFHPLAEPAKRLRHLSELSVFAGRSDGQPRGTTPWLLDDADHAQADLPASYAAFLSGHATVTAAASGQLDLDPETEIVLVASVGDLGETLRIGILERDGTGAIAVTSSEELATGWTGITTARLALGDVDGDGRDEIVLAWRQGLPGVPASAPPAWTLRDDRVDGGAVLHTGTLSPGIRDVAVACADLDGDEKSEIGLLERWDEWSVELEVHELAGGTVQPLGAPLWFAFGISIGESQLLSGRFDADTREELAVVNGTGFPWHLSQIQWQVVDLNAAAELEFGAYGIADVQANILPDDRWSACAADLDGDGLDELALLGPEGDLEIAVVSGVQNGLDGAERNTWVSHPDRSALIAVQQDDDAREEIVVLAAELGSPDVLTLRWYEAIAAGDFNAFVSAGWIQRTATPGGPTGSFAFLPVCESDVDGDDLVLEWTGDKPLSLAEPIPLVAMAAPPTKAGIHQNYGATGTTYTIEHGLEESFGVSTAATLSFSTGVALEDALGLFGASVQSRITSSFEETHTSSRLVTEGISFGGAFDRDLVVFQGTLYQSYVYEIVSAGDPSLVGTTMTIDVPVDSATYKWSVEHYDELVRPDRRIAPLAFGHTIGDPAAYASESDAELWLETYVGWQGEEATVGLGGSANEVFLRIDETNSSASQWSFGVDWEASFRVAGANFGFAIGATTRTIYEVAVVRSSEYRGSVGDITSDADYASWRYDFGLLVYQRGILADAQGEPAGIEAGVQPFHVVTYWTRPVGTGY